MRSSFDPFGPSGAVWGFVLARPAGCSYYARGCRASRPGAVLGPSLCGPAGLVRFASRSTFAPPSQSVARGGAVACPAFACFALGPSLRGPRRPDYRRGAARPGGRPQRPLGAFAASLGACCVPSVFAGGGGAVLPAVTPYHGIAWSVWRFRYRLRVRGVVALRGADGGCQGSARYAPLWASGAVWGLRCPRGRIPHGVRYAGGCVMLRSYRRKCRECRDFRRPRGTSTKRARAAWGRACRLRGLRLPWRGTSRPPWLRGP